MQGAQYLSDIHCSPEHPRLIRAAVVGCGSHAVRNVFSTFQYAPVDLVAVCDLDRGRARDAARVFGAKASYVSMSDMLAAERPEVVFAVLNFDRDGRPRYPDIAVAALEAGAHVWIEKPPASTTADVERMIRAASSAQRFVGVGLKKMFSPANDKSREISSRPEFGGICSITARYPTSLPAYGERSSDAAMMGFLDHIVHPFSILRLIGGSIESLWVEREARTGSSLTTIRFTSGAIGSLHLSAGASWPAPLERTRAVSMAVVKLARSGSVPGRVSTASTMAMRSSWYSVSSAQTSCSRPGRSPERRTCPLSRVCRRAKYADSIFMLARDLVSLPQVM